jgi:hypothetical protein
LGQTDFFFFEMWLLFHISTFSEETKHVVPYLD